MNSKNIKKSLNAKLDKWIESIDDKEVKKVIKNNTIISGGALVSLLTGVEVHDYDVYFKTKEAVLTVAKYYVEKFNSAHKTHAFIKKEEDGRINIFIKSAGVAGEDEEVEKLSFPEVESSNEEPVQEEKLKYRPVYLTSNAITLSDKIQIVIRFWGDVEEIHKNYDFAHCTCSWSSWNNELMLPQKALECIINKELYYIGSKYPLCSIIRARKFINRGYTINAGQYLKMCLQLNELNLHNIEVLKDQLVGVDSAYFDMAIKAVEQKKESDPNWQVDNSYLFEVINRIF
jgi:hypothetical protein